MSYLGRGSNLTRKAQDKVSFLATAGQTVRTGLSYVPTHVDVTVNGITLTEITDYTATNGNSITFTVALALNDEVTIVSSKTFDVANHYTISAANALLAAKAPIASPSFTAKATISIASANGDILDFKSNGSDVGTIGTLGGATYFGSEDSGIMFNGANQNPTSGGSTRVDNTNDLGAASYRYKDIYLGGGAFIGGTSTPNKLDDYEEGTFIPILRGSTNAGSFSTDSAHIGRYTKIGDVCTCNFRIGGTLSNATGSYTHFNLPFTVKAGTVATGSFSYHSTPNLNHVDFSSYVNYGQTLGYFIIKTASAGSSVYPPPSSFMPAGVQIYGTVTYHVA